MTDPKPEPTFTVEIAFDEVAIFGETFPMWVATVTDQEGGIVGRFCRDSRTRALNAAKVAVEEIKNPSAQTSTETIIL